MALLFIKWICWCEKKTFIIENWISDLENQLEEISHNLEEIYLEMEVMKEKWDS